MKKYLHIKENGEHWFRQSGTISTRVQHVLKNIKKGKFFIVYPHEYTWPNCFHNDIQSNKIYKKLKLHFICNLDIDKKRIKKKLGVLEENITITHWPTYWFNTGLGDLHLYQEYNLDPFKLINYKFDKTFICMNGKFREHRGLLLDEIYKQQLENNGYINVLQIPKSNNIYKHWTPEIKTFESQRHYTYNQKDTALKQINLVRMYLPNEWYKAPIHIVPETEHQSLFDNKIFFTEKTSYCLAMLKPFIIVGQQYAHKKLQDYGFKLYDSIFNYEFDNYEKLSDRITAVVEQVKNLCNRDPYELWHITREVAEYNLDKLVEVSKTTIPNFIYDNDLHKDFGEIVLPHNGGRQCIFDFTKFKFYNKIYL